jgi:hypothetical protein
MKIPTDCGSEPGNKMTWKDTERPRCKKIGEIHKRTTLIRYQEKGIKC